jgi:hypothetical protein
VDVLDRSRRRHAGKILDEQEDVSRARSREMTGVDNGARFMVGAYLGVGVDST